MQMIGQRQTGPLLLFASHMLAVLTWIRFAVLGRLRKKPASKGARGQIWSKNY
jgi:hypothetical protein